MLLAAGRAAAILISYIPTRHPLKSFHTHLAILSLTVLAGFAAHAAELESTTPVAAKTNGEAWWNGNCKRIDDDIEKTNGKVDVAFVGDSITARWRG